MLRLFVALCIFGGTLSAAAKLNNKEPCKEVEGVKDFNVTRFAGFWYSVQADEILFNDNETVCPIFDVVVDKNNVLRMWNYLGGGSSLIQDKLNTSKFRMIEPDNDTEATILATDYRSYVVIYSCSIKSNESIEIMARTHEPFTLDFNETIKDVLTKNNLGQRHLSSANLKPCEGIQMVGLGNDEFRDPTVNKDRAHCKRVKGVENFDWTRFMGLWYEMQSSFQDEKNCGPSEFSLVANGTRLHISNSTHNSGYYELSRKYPGTFKMYEYVDSNKILVVHKILETDYDSYAILYVCSPWLQPSKIITLARKNERTDDFRTKIDNALSKVKDLGITYLLLNSQSNCKKD